MTKKNSNRKNSNKKNDPKKDKGPNKGPEPEPEINEVDVDGMPLAPKEVLENSAWAVFNTAIKQAKHWHPPTPKERLLQNNMLIAFKESKINGPSKKTTDIILECADKLGLQCIRAKQIKQGLQDSFLIIYTKKGNNSYSGPFFMLRETKSSKVVLLVPHDLNDGTHTDTKLALSDTQALAVISNGHPKGITPDADFVDHSNTLGSIALRQLQDLFPKPIVLMIHGKKGANSIMTRSRSKLLDKVFIDGCKKFTNVKNYLTFNADYATDRIVRTEMYLKTEMPAQIHINNKKALGNIVRYIEEFDWAYDSELTMTSSNLTEEEEEINTKNDCDNCDTDFEESE